MSDPAKDRLAWRGGDIVVQPATKAVRHVRTAGGVRQYGQPVGTVIVKDRVLTIHHLDAGPKGQRVTATDSSGAKVGHLTWLPDGQIQHVEVAPAKRRQGVATELLRQARAIDPTVHHNDELSTEGRAFATATPSATATVPGTKPSAPTGPAEFPDAATRRLRYGDTEDEVLATLRGLMPRARIQVNHNQIVGNVTVDELTAAAAGIDEIVRRYPNIAHDVSEFVVSSHDAELAALSGASRIQAAVDPVADGARVRVDVGANRYSAYGIVEAHNIPDLQSSTTSGLATDAIPAAQTAAARLRRGAVGQNEPEIAEITQHLMYGVLMHEMFHVVDAHGYVQEQINRSGGALRADVIWTNHETAVGAWPAILNQGGPVARTVFYNLVQGVRSATHGLSQFQDRDVLALALRDHMKVSDYSGENPAEWYAELMAGDALGGAFAGSVNEVMLDLARKASQDWTSRRLKWDASGKIDAVETKAAKGFLGIADSFGPGSVVYDWAAAQHARKTTKS